MRFRKTGWLFDSNRWAGACNRYPYGSIRSTDYGEGYSIEVNDNGVPITGLDIPRLSVKRTEYEVSSPCLFPPRGSRWARVRHNGYRDMASDTECFGAFNPEYAWERFKRILAYQYSNGYCPRTFLDGKINPNNFSDCAVWIPFTAYTLVMELGRKESLLEEVAFNDGTTATVFEHLRRAVEYLKDTSVGS